MDAATANLLKRNAELTYPHVTDAVGWLALEIDEGVFSPDQTTATRFLFEVVDFKGGERVLDAFAGSRVFGLHAAAYDGSTQVVGFDISPAAIAGATKNAALLGLESRATFRLGTLADCIEPHEQFDLIIANPPLRNGEPRSALESAVLDPGLQATEEFVRALPRLLAPKGRGFIIASNFAEGADGAVDISQICKTNGLRCRPVAQCFRTQCETYTVYKIERYSNGLLRLLDAVRPAQPEIILPGNFIFSEPA